MQLFATSTVVLLDNVKVKGKTVDQVYKVTKTANAPETEKKIA
jgi:hypothetical protein